MAQSSAPWQSKSSGTEPLEVDGSVVVVVGGGGGCGGGCGGWCGGWCVGWCGGWYVGGVLVGVAVGVLAGWMAGWLAGVGCFLFLLFVCLWLDGCLIAWLFVWFFGC